MNSNQQIPGYNCDGCLKPIPNGQEKTCIITNYDETEARKCLLCNSCNIRFIKPLFDLKNKKITATSTYEKYIKGEDFSDNTKKLAKELDCVR